jgi:hypothetical protein
VSDQTKEPQRRMALRSNLAIIYAIVIYFDMQQTKGVSIFLEIFKKCISDIICSPVHVCKRIGRGKRIQEKLMIQATVHTCFQALMLEGFGGAGAAQEPELSQIQFATKKFVSFKVEER